ncbi:MAG TPA: alpha/beta fold hydrolase [Burkholderiales bacterium]|nr:alpha/beta fold hydrolase [Burkholderiales bacterium]
MTMHHVRSGKGHHTLVLVHGFLGGSGYWLPQTSGLSDYFDFIAVDLPGFARSAHVSAPDSVGGLAQALIQHLDGLGVRRFSLLGFSMGGMVATELALEHADRLDKLLLYGTSASGTLPDRFESWDTSIQRMEAQGVEATADRTVSSWFVDGDKHPFFPVCREACRGASKEGCIKAMRGMQRWSAKDRLKLLKVPTLVVVGDKDRSTKPAESFEIWQLVPGAQLCVIPDAAHGLHMEKPELFNRVLLDFVLGG